MVKNISVRIVAFSLLAVLWSMTLGQHTVHAFSQYTDTLYETSGRVYVTATGAQFTDSVSLASSQSTPWESALIWMFGSLLVLAAITLIVWTLGTSTASMLPKQYAEKPSVERLRRRNPVRVPSIEIPAWTAARSISTALPMLQKHP